MDHRKILVTVSIVGFFAGCCSQASALEAGADASAYSSGQQVKSPDKSVFATSDPGLTLAKALVDTAHAAGFVARHIGENIENYVRDKQIQKKQAEIVEKFYQAFHSTVQPLNLNPVDYAELRERVEEIYIEDGQTRRYGLDPVYFQDMPRVIQHQYAEMRLTRTVNGAVDEYDMEGRIKRRWQFKNGRPHGTVVTYDGRGEILYIDTYREGYKINRKKYDPEGKLVFSQDYPYEPAVPESGLQKDKAVAQDGTAAAELV